MRQNEKYDNKSRPIRSYSSNYLGGYTYTDNTLTFSGQTEQATTYHKFSAAAAELKVRDLFTYDASGRMLKHFHRINALDAELLSENNYSELGQLKGKGVGGTDGS